MHWTEISRRQAGIVSRRQLLSAGYDASKIKALVAGARLESTRFTGVYRAAGSAPSDEANAWCAVLDADAVLSYLSAATWWGIDVPADQRVHITVLRRRRTTVLPAVRVHRVALLDSAVTRRFGMPITTRAETVLDCAGWLDLSPASVLIDRGLQQRWIELSDVGWRLENQPGRWGNRQLSRLYRQATSGARSQLERRMHALLRTAGFPPGQANYKVTVGSRTYLIDIAFPERLLAIELDGWAFHSDVSQFQQDRSRSNALVAAGWTVLRFTWADVTQRPNHVRTVLATVLADLASPVEIPAKSWPGRG